MQQEEAQSIAITALSFLANDQKLLDRFMAISGIEGQDIRQAAASHGFFAGVLSFLLHDEPTLMDFCQNANIQPTHIIKAFTVLPGGSPIDF